MSIDDRVPDTASQSPGHNEDRPRRNAWGRLVAGLTVVALVGPVVFEILYTGNLGVPGASQRLTNGVSPLANFPAVIPWTIAMIAAWFWASRRSYRLTAFIVMIPTAVIFGRAMLGIYGRHLGSVDMLRFVVPTLVADLVIAGLIYTVVRGRYLTAASLAALCGVVSFFYTGLVVAFSDGGLLVLVWAALRFGGYSLLAISAVIAHFVGSARRAGP